jgi:hypothetical protein
MDKAELQALQAPLKDQYRAAPDAALITLSAEGTLDPEGVSCTVATGRALVEAGYRVGHAADYPAANSASASTAASAPR